MRAPVCPYARAQVCTCACGVQTISAQLHGSSWACPGTRPCLGSSFSPSCLCCPCQMGIPRWPAGTVGWAALGALRWAQEALVAPPGSGSQAPGQLVAISSVDYLVVMPSGARALSPAPQETLLAGVQGPLGLKHINACMVSVGAGGFCGSRLCLCARTRMHCRSAAYLGVITPVGTCACLPMFVQTYLWVCISKYMRGCTHAF